MIVSEIYSKIENYLFFSSFNILDIEKVSNNAIFKSYFNAEPPFAEKGDKKSEFPDAFMIAALEIWTVETGNKMYIVSSDKDFEKSCEDKEDLIIIDNIDKLFDLFINEEKIRDEIEELFKENKLSILDSIQSELDTHHFYVNDEDGDVLEINVNSINMDDDEIYILELDKEAKTAEITFSVDIDLDAEIEYFDTENSAYDSEIKGYAFKRYKTVNNNFVFNTNIKLTFNYDQTEEQDFEISNVLFNDNNDIDLELHRDWY